MMDYDSGVKGIELDRLSLDYNVRRKPGESDEQLRTRFLKALQDSVRTSLESFLGQHVHNAADRVEHLPMQGLDAQLREADIPDSYEYKIEWVIPGQDLNKPCDHTWAKYEGFTERYHYCTKCDTKKQ